MKLAIKSFLRIMQNIIGKVLDRWSGSYVVTKKRSDLNYVVRLVHGTNEFTVNVMRMKKWHPRSASIYKGNQPEKHVLKDKIDLAKKPNDTFEPKTLADDLHDAEKSIKERTEDNNQRITKSISKRNY